MAAGSLDHSLGASARRVVIKSRFVVLRLAGAKSVSTHLCYIEREGVTRNGQRGQAYGAEVEKVDLKGFEERGRGDRHQFRFIVSAEDAVELDDLKGFTRQLMRRMEIDRETPLDWVAVDHWDTDNPHTHIVLRGRVGSERQGRDLVIAPDYLASGMRLRASAIASEWLGPRTEVEIRQSLQREVDGQRLTSLDRQLLRQASVGTVDLTEAPSSAIGVQRQTLLRARLQRLEAMALAGRIDANRWQLAPSMEQTLAAMGDRGDILRTMHRAMRGEQRELVIEPQVNSPVNGRIAAKGLDDELHDRPYLVIDGIDGRVHYLKLPVGTDLAELPIGGIVGSRPPAHERAVDRNILSVTRDGIYNTASHEAQLAQTGDPAPQVAVEAHVRRLEALRRSGIVQRLTDGVWAVPPDLLQKARQHDAQKTAGHAIKLHSHLPIEQQVKAMGATWLDRTLVGGDARGHQFAGQGFGAQVRAAMIRRQEFLIEQGLIERRGQRIGLARNLLATLREREVALVGQDLQRQIGKTWHQVQDGQRFCGIYRQSLQLVSGRFAMLDGGISFSLVPWRQVIEPHLGRLLGGVVHGASVNWTLGLQR